MARKITLPAVVNGYNLHICPVASGYVGWLIVNGSVVREVGPYFTRKEACLQTLALAQDLGSFPGEEGVESVERAMREEALA